MTRPAAGTVHHIELWVPDLPRATAEWSWLLEALGYLPFQSWSSGRSWRLGDTYLVIEQSPAMTAGEHDRKLPGLNHLAFYAARRPASTHSLTTGKGNGWTLMFADTHPRAGGVDHYAAYLTNTDGYEVELVAVTT